MAELSRRLRLVLGAAAVVYVLATAVLLTSGGATWLLALVSIVTIGVLLFGASGILDHDGLLLGGALVLALLGVYQGSEGRIAIAIATLAGSAVVFLQYGNHAADRLDEE